MGRKILVGALLGAALSTLLALPAGAQQTSVSFAGPVTAGQPLELRCPEGFQVEFVGTSPNAAANFYRNDKRHGEIATGIAPDTLITDASNVIVGVAWVVPKGARYATAGLVCEPVPTTTQTFVQTGVAETTSVTVDCPSSRPYLAWVYEVLGDSDGDLSTWQGQSLLAYEITPTGVRFGIPIGWAYRVTIECTSVAPTTAA
jgi:hypothetical protein